jgi:hydroxymethylbilane synthase
MDRTTELLDADKFPPAVAQGAIALETRDGDSHTNHIAAAIIDGKTTAAATAERALLKTLEGGCQVPLGAFAEIENGILTLRASLLSLDGTKRIDKMMKGSPEDAARTGRALATGILENGGSEILTEIRRNPSSR